MPDKRKHRGQRPGDDRLFAASQHDTLRAAVSEYAWLLTRGYATESALKLVGDRHGLTARQRVAVQRSSCSDQSLAQRRATRRTLRESSGRGVAVDGYNLLITVESALSGGLILQGRDGCYRDLASVHGTYRKVEETMPALETILSYLAGMEIPRVDWYLDAPVSNSGRLKALMADVLAARDPSTGSRTTWNIELVDNPDAVLIDCEELVVTSDSVVLDRCGGWLNIAADIIDALIPAAWIVDLRAQGDST